MVVHRSAAYVEPFIRLCGAALLQHTIWRTINKCIDLPTLNSTHYTHSAQQKLMTISPRKLKCIQVACSRGGTTQAARISNVMSNVYVVLINWTWIWCCCCHCCIKCTIAALIHRDNRWWSETIVATMTTTTRKVAMAVAVHAIVVLSIIMCKH